MNILLDNTGFQNFGKCFFHSLDPKNNKFGIKDFLQICIQIVFYDKITISTIVPKKIKEYSDEIIDVIKNIDCDIIDTNNLNLQNFELSDILDDIAEEYYDKIDHSFNKCRKLVSIKSSNKNHIPDLDIEATKLFSFATDAIREKNENAISMLAEKSKNEKIDSSFFDIVTRKIKSKKMKEYLIEYTILNQKLEHIIF
jgi:hypothetical protein